MDTTTTLVLIGYYLPRERRCFKRGREDYEEPPRQPINDFFYEQRKDFADLMRGWTFREGTHFPTNVNQAVSNLVASRLIIVSSDFPWHYHFAPSVDYCFKMISSETSPTRRLTTSENSQLQKLTERFNEKVACPVVLNLE